MNEIQTVQFDILREFARVLERKKLRYFAMFGTLLGAARHAGFIPWDRDIDVAVPREEYNRLRAMPEMFRLPYFLQTTSNDPGAAPTFMRLRRDDTAYIENFPNGYTRGGNMGICIDIIPLDRVPDIEAARRAQSAARTLHRQMLGSAAFDESGGAEQSDFKEKYCYRHAGVPGCYSFFAECYERICSSFSDGHYYAMPVLRGERGSRVYDREWFRESVLMRFEGLEISVPAGWRETLAVSYPEGFYERPPRYRPVAEPPKDCIIDTQRSYREYTRRYTDAFSGIENKKVFFFGAGDSLRICLERYCKGLNVVCAFDNARAKWGGSAYGVPIRSPKELPTLLDSDSRLVIASIYYKEIAEQLNKMGIQDYFIFVDGWNYGAGA